MARSKEKNECFEDDDLEKVAELMDLIHYKEELSNKNNFLQLNRILYEEKYSELNSVDCLDDNDRRLIESYLTSASANKPWFLKKEDQYFIKDLSIAYMCYKFVPIWYSVIEFCIQYKYINYHEKILNYFLIFKQYFDSWYLVETGKSKGISFVQYGKECKCDFCKNKSAYPIPIDLAILLPFENCKKKEKCPTSIKLIESETKSN